MVISAASRPLSLTFSLSEVMAEADGEALLGATVNSAVAEASVERYFMVMVCLSEAVFNATFLKVLMPSEERLRDCWLGRIAFLSVEEKAIIPEAVEAGF